MRAPHSIPRKGLHLYRFTPLRPSSPVTHFTPFVLACQYLQMPFLTSLFFFMLRSPFTSLDLFTRPLPSIFSPFCIHPSIHPPTLYPATEQSSRPQWPTVTPQRFTQMPQRPCKARRLHNPATSPEATVRSAHRPSQRVIVLTTGEKAGLTTPIRHAARMATFLMPLNAWSQ